MIIKMESYDELKEINVKNCMCHFFDDIKRELEILIVIIFYYFDIL